MRVSTVVAPIFLVLSLFAAFLAMREYRVARMSQGSTTDLFQTLAFTPPRRALSLRADSVIFSACHRSLRSSLRQLQPAEVVNRIATYCLETAKSAATATPNSGQAHYTWALAAYQLEQPGIAAQHLARSQQVAPFESWLARRRFRLAVPLQQELQDGATDLVAPEVTGLLQSPNGRDLLARYYVATPDLRDQITALAEDTNPEIQASLLGLIKKEIRRRNGS